MRPSELNPAIGRLENDLSALQYLYTKLWLLMRLHGAKIVLFSGLAAATLLAFEIVKPPQYTASALVRVGSTAVDEAVLQLRSQSTNVQAVLGRARAISAPNVIRRAVEDDALSEIPQLLDPGAAPIDAMAALFGAERPGADQTNRIAENLAAIKADALERGMSIESAVEANVALVIEDGLRASPAGTSNLVEVSFTATDPLVAEHVVNAVVRAYFALETEIGQKQLERGVSLYGDQSDTLRAELSSLQRELQERRSARADDGLNPASLKSAIAVLTEEITQTETRIRRDEANLEALTSATSLTSTGIALDALGGQALRPLVEAAAARERRARLSGDAQPDDTSSEQRALDLAVAEFVAAKTAILEDSRQTIVDLRLDLNSSVAELSRMEGIMAEDAGLEADIRTTRDLLERAQSRAGALVSTSGLLDTQSTIVSAAVAPLTPDARSKVALLAKLIVLASFVGGLVFLLSLIRDRTYRFSGALAQDIAAPALRALPRRFVGAGLADRNMTAFLKRLGIDKTKDRPFCLLLCSVGKGKSKQIGAFSQTLETSNTGHRCLIVDCVGSERTEAGVECALSPEMTRTELRIDMNSPDDFKDKASMISRLASNTHDAVVFVLDTPQMLPADRTGLEFCDATVFVAEWGRTKRKDVRNLPDFPLLAEDDSAAGKHFALLLSVPRFIRDFETQFGQRHLA